MQDGQSYPRRFDEGICCHLTQNTSIFVSLPYTHMRTINTRMCTYISMYIYVMYIYIYVYKERERERDTYIYIHK